MLSHLGNTISRHLNKWNSTALQKLIALSLALAIIALALLSDRRFAVSVQGQSEGRNSSVRLVQIAAEAEGSVGIEHHQPTNSLLLSAGGRAELMGAGGSRTLFLRLAGNQNGRFATVRETRNGFNAGESFVGTEAPGVIARIAADGSRVEDTWVALPGETGMARALYVDPTGLFNGDLIAATTVGGIWQIDSAGNARRVTPMITARSESDEDAPVALDSVIVAPNDPVKYGPLAAKILATAGGRGMIYAIGADGIVESFDPGISRVNNILVIPAKENFFGIAADRQATDQATGRTTNQRGIWGAPAEDFEALVGDLLVTQAGGEACHCPPALWRMHWNGAEFEKTKLAQLPGVSETTEWGQVTFSPFGAELLQQQNQATPVVGPFAQASAMGPTGNNDDFTLQEVTVAASGGLTTAAENVRFINTLRNVGMAAGNFIVSAPTIPAGFTVSVSSDSGATFASLNSGGTVRTPTPVQPNEDRNLDVRITAPAGLSINTNYELVIQVSSDTNAALFNRTIDRIRFVPPPSPAPLVGPFDRPDAVGPTGNNDDFTLSRVNLQIINGMTTVPGTVRFINTLRNVGTAPGRFVVSAPTIPQGFNVRVSVDSGATFVSLNGGGSTVTPTPVNVNESRNLDVRVELPTGLAVNTDYDVVIQVSREGAASEFNRTIDRVRPDPNPPNLTLAKAVRDLSGNDLNGRNVQRGQIIEYTLTLRNAGASSVGNTFIAEYLPPNLTYVANSTQITAGPNAGAKTDARGDDQVDYFPNGFVNGQINIFTGTGATALRGGTLAPNESTTVALRVMVNNATPLTTVINNGADWGAEDFGIGGKSNIVTVTVGMMPMAVPLLGPFAQPGATGPTDNNDDFTLSKVNLNISGGLTTVPGTVRFINTLRNAGDLPGRFVISAPTIPTGFSARISVDSGATFVNLNGGGTATLPSDMSPGEERNLDVRIDLPTGLAVDTNYDLVLQATLVGDASKSNRTIDRVRPDPNAPNLTLVKAVRDLTGRDVSGATLCPGQTIEYTLTLRNAGTTPVGNTFIAEYLPPNVTYVANSTQITAGANAGAKTDTRGDDQVDYFPNGFVNGQINIFTGTGATALRGGTLAPNESTTVAFRVTINATTPAGTVIRNGADWGAEDFGIGGKSNIVEVTAGSAQAPVITTQPASQTVCVGNPVTFSVTATGGTLSYQWRRNGTAIAGATSNTLTINSAAASDAGSYDVVVTNACGGTTSSPATLTVNQPTAITAQPANQTVCAGQSATFTVAATGANLTYQWRKNGANIAGATSSGFSIASATPSDAGSYDVVVTGACGTATSNVATLTVNPATAITTQPVSQVSVVGQSVTFSVTATGANLTYQWRKNGAPIAGATSSSFTIAAVALTDAGNFDVVVTGTCGAVTSSAAILTVNPAPSDACRHTICFRSAAYFSLNFGTNAIPRGSVLIGGVNLNNPVASTDTRVRLALNGAFGVLNREYVTAQLNVLGASGLGAADVASALASQLRCYGLDFSRVMVTNAEFTTETTLFNLLNYTNSAVQGGASSRDTCVLIKLLNALNGNRSANVCNRSTGVIDFGSCN